MSELPQSDINPFESGFRKVIPAVLVYVRHQDHVLMLYRNAGVPLNSPLEAHPEPSSRKIDYHHGKWNGLGGKCELDESPLETAIREVKEESGLKIPPSKFQALGVLQFPNFKAHKNEDWIAYVFVADLDSKPSGELTSPEGELHWIPAAEVTQLNLWAGDRYFIPYVLDRKPFVGTIWYDGQIVKRHWFTEL